MKTVKLLSCMGLSFLMVSCMAQQSTNHNPSMEQHTTTTMSQQPSSNQPLTDTAITADIKSQFIAKDLFTSKDIAAMSIHVKTINGVVYLTGTADNKTQARNAVMIAKKVKGVKRVISKVMIVKSQ